MKSPHTPLNISFGIVTYHARFETYFMPLIQRLTKVFPESEILVVLNGHPDQTLQMNYLKKATEVLSKYPNVRYLSFEQHQSLCKGFNQIMILSNTEKVLMINDDTQITDLFREEFEKKIYSKNLPFAVINKSWSHHLVSKSIIKKVGWYDERLLGMGQEDFDYSIRMGIVGIPIVHVECLGIDNYVAPATDPGWKAISKKHTETKYAQVNFDFVSEKWIKNSTGTYSPGKHQPTPMFYDLSCLDIGDRQAYKPNRIYKNNRSKIIFQKIAYLGENLLKKIYRSVVR